MCHDTRVTLALPSEPVLTAGGETVDDLAQAHVVAKLRHELLEGGHVEPVVWIRFDPRAFSCRSALLRSTTC